MISQRIGQAVREPGAKEVDFSKLTTFGWEYFYFFKPGTPRATICAFIRASRNNCGRVVRYEAVPSTHVALFFGLNGNLTHTELHALANGEFDFDLPPDGISKTAAVFRIRRSTSAGGERVILEVK
ncbi:hypothetical protein [Aquabacterium humicola]|uniref:hypothetical protein n=1 Tax=Aquabacterium humicola TaxID=3237377 RepID=UPI002543D659|nr:hypothetical protein [Rubrivivax pictus]